MVKDGWCIHGCFRFLRLALYRSAHMTQLFMEKPLPVLQRVSLHGFLHLLITGDTLSGSVTRLEHLVAFAGVKHIALATGMNGG